MKTILNLQLAASGLLGFLLGFTASKYHEQHKHALRRESMRNHPSYTAELPATTDGKGTYYANVKSEVAP